MRPKACFAVGAVLVTALVAVTTSCADPAAPRLEPTYPSMIIGGTADNGAYPYVGALDLRPTGRSIPCSGTLISPTVFLTAGHCTTFLDEAGVTLARVTFDPTFGDAATFHTGTVHTNSRYVPFMTGAQSGPGDFGVIVFLDPVQGIVPAALPKLGLLDDLGPVQLRTLVFPTVGYGISRQVGGSDGGGPPDIDRSSAGTRRIATQTFSSLTDGWLRLSMLDDGQVCTGDSGAPNLLGGTNQVVAIGIGGDWACVAMDAALRVDTPAARAFLSEFVALP